MDGGQRLPRPRRAGRPGGRHLRGPRHARRPAPGAARDGRPRRVPVRLLHARASSAAWPPSTTAPDRAAAARHRRPQRRHDEHGPNGFDLHALSGNLCRCTGYRPIRDAAYALGPPADDDPSRRRREPPAPAAARHPAVERRRREFVRPADLAEALALLGRATPTPPSSRAPPTGASRSTSAAPAPPLVIAVDRLAELREFCGRRRTRRDRRRPHPHRDRAAAGRAGAAAGRSCSRSSRRG